MYKEEWGELLKRKIMQMAQLEWIMETGSIEYQEKYHALEKDLSHASCGQINEASSLLKKMFQSQKKYMSSIEQEIYRRSILKLDSLRTKNL